MLSSGRTMLVVFEATHCEPCEALAPVLESLAQEFAERALVVRVQQAEEAWLAARHHLVFLPTLTFWRAGREVARVVGAAQRGAIREHLSFLVGEGPEPPAATGPRRTIRVPFAPHAEPDEPLAVDDASFEDHVLRSRLPVLVDFWAPWCPPCRAMEPVVKALAREYAGRVRVAQVDTDTSPRWSSRLGVRGIPTFVLFRGGAEVDRFVGALPSERLSKALDRLLA